MSNAALTWCVKLHPGPGPKAVLLCLSDRATDHSGEDWTCFPSVKDICEFTDLGARTVERHLTHLWREGIISRKRRRRADGTLGIYDYTLHRDAERRAELKAARERVEDVDAAMEADEPPANLAAGPHDKLAGGPPAKFDATTRQIVREPPANLAGQEPSVEPSDNPQTGVRGRAGALEPGDEGFDQAFAAFPTKGRLRSSPPAARAAWALWAGRIGVAALMDAIRRYGAEDPDVRRGVCLPFERWLSTERFRHWLGEPEAASGPVDAGPRTGFAGPPELRALIVASVANGEAFARSYVDRAAWDAATSTLTPASAVAAERLGEIRRIIREYGASLGAVGAGRMTGRDDG